MIVAIARAVGAMLVTRGSTHGRCPMNARAAVPMVLTRADQQVPRVNLGLPVVLIAALAGLADMARKVGVSPDLFSGMLTRPRAEAGGVGS